MPNRLLKETICTSDNIDQLSAFAEIAFYRLIVNCDDFGRMDARTKILKSRLFPLKTVDDNKVANAMKELEEADLITLYTVGGKPYLQMNTWKDHQQVRNQKSKYPSPDDADGKQMQAIDSNCNQLISNDINREQKISNDSKSPRNPIQYESESNPNTSGRFTPPTLEEVTAYCTERNNGIDPEYFMDYHIARNWILSNGKQARDWKAVVRTWEKNGINRQQKPVRVLPVQDYNQRDYSGAQDDAIQRFMKQAGGGKT